MLSEYARPEPRHHGSGLLGRTSLCRVSVSLLVSLALACPLFARDRISGPPLTLPRAYAENARVDVIDLRTKFIQARPDFEDSFHWQVSAYLQRCARGEHRLKRRVRIDEIDKADLVGRVFKRGTHNMAGAMEFVSRESGKVVGRYYFDVTTGSGGPLKALVAEPEFLLSNAFGKYLCQEVFE